MCSNRITVLCNQENFLLRGNAYKVKQALPSCHVLFKEAKKETLDNGRPSNGMFIALPAAYSSSITDVSPDHWRLQAAILKSDNTNILLINSYFPNDSGLQNILENDLEAVLVAIEDVINSNSFSTLILSY